MSVSIEPRSRLLNTRAAVAYLGGSSRLLQRCVYSRPAWLTPIYRNGKGGNNLYDLSDLDAVVTRLRSGEKPPLLRCERKAKEVA